ncbi:sacsin [Mytilus galloprovincialis]|uniref:Sacsin n=1 Tax=Mytilus galloprovincialis TaxID=29158 RepID=A0A8B6CZ19_MYTGA|nr:sacsin [Mytilus galloprovincialis]
MASSEESEDSSEDGPQYNAIKQPPLINQLKKILDEYPDDGQILKEIIQNAEDAEASQMKILFDERIVNTEDGTKGKRFKKYFKGPALCVYNNANFTKEDWEGIQMINSSVKEFDPVKIGRFGLGFKSVFHITDYPMIISGNTLLVLDPHQKNSTRVCINMKLNKLHTCKYMKLLDVSYCLNALDGLFGFSQGTLDSGDFDGTLFRFPLREQKTNLSDNVYDKEKILDLFNAFQAEASVELLFLKCLEKIELCFKDEDGFYTSDEPFFTVGITDNCLNQVRERRLEFHSHMKSVGLNIADETMMTTFNVTIGTKAELGDMTEQSWFVLHCLKGGNVSKELADLSKDESLSYSPYVSIAVPMDKDQDFKGHVFCLMPLPLEDESLTGYPVHVNGYFALSQNRRHVKWPTADQTRNKAHIDKSIRWNKRLVVEVLADVYHAVIQDLIQTCKKNGNAADQLQLMYKSVPDHRNITSHWDLIVDPFFEELLKTPFLYSNSCGGKWICPDEAVFQIFEGEVSDEVKQTIYNLMQKYSIALVDAPDHIVAVLTERTHKVQTLSREFVSSCMKSDSSYESISTQEKINLLHYLISDGDYSRLIGLNLLPLNNDTFCDFINKNHTNSVFVCKEEVLLFPGQEEKFVKVELKEEIYNKFWTMAKQGLYQLVSLQDRSPTDIASLLQESIAKYIGATSNRSYQWRQTDPVGMVWIKKVWSYIQQYDLSHFSHMHLIPDTRTHELYKISTIFLLKSNGSCDIPSDVCNCLRYFDIVILDEIPDEIEDHKNIRNFVYLPTVENVFKTLANVQKCENTGQFVNKFNSSVTETERSQFVIYISNYSKMSDSLISLLSDLNLFKEKNSCRFVSINQVKTIAESDDLPVRYFRETLDCSDLLYRNLAKLLQAEIIDKEDVIIEILKNLEKEYDSNDRNTMVEYVLNNLSLFHKKEGMLGIAKHLEFVNNKVGQKKKASQLFDPEDEIISLVILDDKRLPDTKNLPISLQLLRKLGLKSWHCITAEDILSCAKHIQENSKCSDEKQRSGKLLQLLHKASGLLNSNVDGIQLSQQLSNIEFIAPSPRKDNFPVSLPWLSETSSTLFYRPCDMINSNYTRLVGSVKPILNTSTTDNLVDIFGWNKEPSSTDVIDQLLVITKSYEDRNKPELLPVINDIYKFLSSRSEPKNAFQQLTSQKWIWTGNGFESSDKVYLQTGPNDIYLHPYMFPLPTEFHDQVLLKFFRKMNCIEDQNTRLLMRVQTMIRDKYKRGRETVQKAKTDLQLVVSILNILKDANEADIESVLLPIQQRDERKVILKPVKECSYCEDDDDIYGDERDFVHHMVPREAIEKFGVPSVADTLLEDTEQLEEWGQSEPLTRRIKTLLDAYRDGLSVPKEIIQNADDAGATEVRFLYDERDGEKYGRKLLDRNMFDCQGPSLWAYNNARFSTDDLKNITKLNGATKEADTTKIGKFGLGFCSVYNLTDVPSFVTGNQMVIFDPHYEYLGDALRRKRQPGLKIDFRRNKNILERKYSQFEPYNGVFGCNLNVEQDEILFDGTLFRLPLRTRKQSGVSEISDVPYDHRQMISLMKILMESGGNLLLFTQNVSKVEFYHLPRTEKDPTKATLLYTVRRHIEPSIERPISKVSSESTFSILKSLAECLVNKKKENATEIPVVQKSILFQISITTHAKLSDFKIEASSSTTPWFATWASGTDKSKDMALESSKKGVIPLACIACPLKKLENGTFKTLNLKYLPDGFYRKGHIFCFLPLPVETNYPVHINGSFAVTSDRRNIVYKAVDDKDSFDNDWNEALMNDAVCNAYILLLENLPHYNIDQNEPYYKQWPGQYGQDTSIGDLQTSFYRRVSDTRKPTKVFRRNSTITHIGPCKFLDNEIMKTEFGEEAFSVCVKLLDDGNTKMMKLPKEIQDCFKAAERAQVVAKRVMHRIDFFSNLVFPHLKDNVWNEHTKDMLILHALDNASGKMSDMLKEHRCIPTAPNRLFRRPSELIDRKGELKGLFKDEDERFVIDGENMFCKDSRLKTLNKLGMATATLSDELLIDRAVSIQSLAAICSHCGLDRCIQFVQYLNRELPSIQKKSDLFRKLQSIQFLPIKIKSNDWLLSWGGDKVSREQDLKGVKYICNTENHNDKFELRFEKPQLLYMHTIRELVCSIQPVLDENCFSTDIDRQNFIKLGVRRNVSPILAMENLLAISQSASCDDNMSGSLELLNSTVFAIYKFINEQFLKHQNDSSKRLPEIAERYKDESILLLNDMFVKPSQAVVHSTEDCSPHFYTLNSHKLKSMHGLIECLQIEERCSSERVLSELRSYKSRFGETEMTDAHVKLYVRLLKVLVEAMQIEKLEASAVKDLYIPDTTGVLHPIHRVCIDGNVRSTANMHFTHASISHEISLALGISTKRQFKVEECSKDLFSQDFGQHEELITRIKRILTGYPCDAGVLKELLQNADDAKASEVHIVLDYNSYPTDDLFDEKWEPLQGPAILVYNDSYFSEADLKGIQNLGIGSKVEDPTKTGQYGVGFNAVYHLTDVPSFLTRGKEVETGEILCVLDPHCQYISKATSRNPGRKFINTTTLREDHPNVFNCYHDTLLMTQKKKGKRKAQGTIFRLPLRSSKFTESSQISKHEITKEFAYEILQNFKNEMSTMLLFVNNVKTIKFSEISDGELVEMYSVKMNLSKLDEDDRLQFYKKIEQNSRLLRKNHTFDCLMQDEINYIADIDDSSGVKSKWLIFRRLGFLLNTPCPQSIQNAYQNGNLGLLPRGGVAVPIQEHYKKNSMTRGRIFCFLPLPLETGLPVHVNGHFALEHEARRNLWTDEEDGYRSAWNKHLINDIIAPSYALALRKMRDILDIHTERSYRKQLLDMKLTLFHSYLPNYEEAKNEYFRLLVCRFYRWVYMQEIPLFSFMTSDGKDEAFVQFVPLACDKAAFPCVYNYFEDQESFKTAGNMSSGISDRLKILKSQEKSSTNQCDLVQIFKRLGIKLLSFPKHVLRGLKEAEIKFQSISPTFVISFLKSYNSTENGSCQLKAVDKMVNETVFQNIVNVEQCIKYCQDSDTFNDEMEDLPLCVTGDGFIRTFKCERPIFWSRYSSIVPESSHRFLHDDIYDLFTLPLNGLAKFDLLAFASVLPNTISARKYKTHNLAVSWNSENDNTPNKNWLENVWTYIDSETAQFYITGPSNPEEYAKLLNPLLSWCLVPCRQSDCSSIEGSKTNVLFPIGRARYVLDLQSYKGPIEIALERLALPCLDENFIKKQDSILSKLVVSTENARSLVYYLHEYRNDLKDKTIRSKDSLVILEFISQNLDEILKDAMEDDLLSKIKELPLHVTISGQKVSLNTASNVLILDQYVSKDIVTDGLKDWASKTETILLKSTQHLKSLYIRLGFTTEKYEAIDVYSNFLLPKFGCLPQKYHLNHLVFIRDKLLTVPVGQIFNTKQCKLISILKETAFVPATDGKIFKASHFKCPFNTVMKLMCNPDQFPVAPFSDKQWNEFLKIADIQFKVTPKMVVDFAHIVERLAENGITEEVRNKSKMLVAHIMSRKNVATEGVLRDISTIRFLLPYKADDWQNKIYKQKNMWLICYRDSVPQPVAYLGWTTCSVLPQEADLCRDRQNLDKKQKEIQSQLGIHNEPPIDSVIQHVQNICNALHAMADLNLIEDSNVVCIKDMMKKIYEWLKGKMKKHSDCLTNLSKTPVVFIPDSKMFVTCDRTVKSFDQKNETEIRPFLMRVPDEYGEYFKLFQLLGMSTSTSVCNYVRVLEYLHSEVGDAPLNINELKIVRMASQQLLKHLLDVSNSDTETLKKMDTLFLLTRQETLQNAKTLVLSDNKDFEEKIGSDIGMPYVMEFSQLDIFIQGSISERLKKLPEKMQPNILSDTISKELTADNLVRVQDGRGNGLKDFFTSHQFTEGVVRIYVHCCKQHPRANQININQDQVEQLVKGIRCLRIVQVESILLRLVFNGKTVGHSEKSCFFKMKSDETNNEHVLYCAFKEKSLQQWLVDNYDSVGLALKKCTDDRFEDTGGLLMKILTRIDKPSSISKALDEAGILEYKFARNAHEHLFPPAGTVVNQNRHCFLDSSFTNFTIGEYVALLISEETVTNRKFVPAVYIYAIIVKKIESDTSNTILGNTLSMYEVDVGNGNIEQRKAYDLFKFNRKNADGNQFNGQEPSESKELEEFVGISGTEKDERPLDDILKEIKEQVKAAWTLPEDERRKVIKRLYKKWHPDKNHGNEKIATEVFKYLRKIVLQLERGEDIDSDKTSDSSSSRSNFYENFKSYHSNDRSRSKFYSNFRHYSDDNSGRYAGSHSTFWSDFGRWEYDTWEDSYYRSSQGNRSRGTRHQTRDEKVPSVAEARQWMRQAKMDYTAADQFFPHALSGQHFNWICIMCYQCVEKVLKAMHYTKDCNNVPSTHDLNKLLFGLNMELQTKVKQFMVLVGPRDRTMYPERMNIPKIPADVYTKETAESTRDITKEILEFAADLL